MQKIKDWFKCLFGKHDIEVIQYFQFGEVRRGCRQCKKEWLYHFELSRNFVWDYERQSYYRNILGYKLINPSWYEKETEC